MIRVFLTFLHKYQTLPWYKQQWFLLYSSNCWLVPPTSSRFRIDYISIFLNIYMSSIIHVQPQTNHERFQYCCLNQSLQPLWKGLRQTNSTRRFRYNSLAETTCRHASTTSDGLWGIKLVGMRIIRLCIDPSGVFSKVLSYKSVSATLGARYSSIIGSESICTYKWS